MKIINWQHSFLLLVATLGMSLGLSAQSLKPLPSLVKKYREAGVQFVEHQPFAAASVLDEEAAKFAQGAQFLTLNGRSLQAIMAEKPAALSLILPYGSETVTVDLVQMNPLTDDFLLETSAEPGKAQRFECGAHYRGIVRGDARSLAAFSFFHEEIMGLISDSEHGNRVVGRLDKPGNSRDYIFYDDHLLSAPNPFQCHTVDTPLDPKEVSEPPHGTPEVNGCVRIFFEVDNELFVNKGSVQNTLNYVTGAFNQMATLYTNEQVQTQLSQVFVWVNADFYNTQSSSTVLSQFVAFRTSFNADLAHHVGIGGNNYGGIAYIDGICTTNAKYAVSDINTSFSNVPTYSWTIEVLTHETGHNMGSRHTHWCGWTNGAIDNCATPEGSCNPGPAPVNGGTIMSYCHLTANGINFNNGFGPQPGNKIRTTVQAKTCLAANCASFNTCLPPSAITVSSIGNTFATIAWTAIGGATSYQLRYRPVGASAWTTVSNATSPHTINGLPANDEIEVTLQSTCSSLLSGYRYGVIFKTLATASCNAPTGVSASSITSNSATITWAAAAGAVSYNVWKKLSSSTNWGNLTNVTTTSINLTGLTANSSYDVRVQTVCASNTSTTYGTTTFTTQAAGSTCNAPSGVTASGITSNSATITWSTVTSAVSYNVWKKLSSTTNWGTLTNVSSPTISLTGLTANSAYDVRVQTVCSSGTSTTYGTTTFTTSASGNTCNAPTNLAASSIAQTSALISWTAAANAVSYKIWKKLSSSTNWGSSTTVNGTSTTLNNLTANTSYDVRVQTVCVSSSSTTYATMTFSTLPNAGACNPPTGLNATPTSNTEAFIAWNPVSGATEYGLAYRLSSSNVAIPINSIPGTSYDLAPLQPGASYFVKVRTFCSATNSWSAYSAEVPFTMPTLKPGEGNATERRSDDELEAILALPVGEITLAPNPTTGNVLVGMNLGKAQNARVELLDVFGKTIDFQRVTFQTGIVEFDLSALPAGSYFVRVATGNDAPLTKRLVKE